MKIFPEFQKKALYFLIFWMIIPPAAIFLAIVVSEYQDNNMSTPTEQLNTQ